MSSVALEQFNPYMSEADVAHAILKAKGAPLYFSELFEEVLVIKPIGGKDKARVMAGIHTELNLDSRFVHVGQGVWGLREWMPGRRIELNDSEDELDN